MRIKEKLTPQEFGSLAQLVQRATVQEGRMQNMRGRQYQTVYADYPSDSKVDDEINLVEWSRNKKTILCPWVKKKTKQKRFDFDINKADKIFDLLLQEKKIHLPPNHTMSPPEELKKAGSASGIIPRPSHQ